LTIALVILHADPARGGAERYTADLAAALAARKHRVSILAKDFGTPIAGVEFVPLAGRRMTRTGEYVRFLGSLDAHLANHSYDIVHAMLPVRRCSVYHPHAGLAADTVAAKWANRFHLKRRLFAGVERKLLRSVRPPVVLCLSNYVKQTIRRHYDLADNRLATLFNAVDLGRFSPDSPRDRVTLKIKEDSIVALMVAQDFARKGLHQAITALAQAGEKRLLLLVVGKDHPATYQRLAKSLKIADQVRFIGPVADPRPFYAAADFFVLPTRHDPCSLVVLEALAMGLPVISTAFNGACEIMKDGRHGFVLPDPQDVSALAAVMRKMLDPAERLAMREACLALRPALSFDAHVDRLLPIYDACSKSAQKSAAR
jgi:UDP-glucose:(heptosyl)LPS alpha-1,3-glucosyltransferase